MSDTEDAAKALAAMGDLSLNFPNEEIGLSQDSSGDPSPLIRYGDEVVGERGSGDGRESGLEETDATDEEEEGGAALQDASATSAPSNQSGGVLNPEPSSEEACNGSGVNATSAPCLLPWGARKERLQFPLNVNVDTDLRPGEFVMRTLFAEFTVVAEKKIDQVMQEPLERSLSKSLQRGEDANFDQLFLAFGNVSEQCLPSLLRTLFAWYTRQGVAEWGSVDAKYKQDPNKKRCHS